MIELAVAGVLVIAGVWIAIKVAKMVIKLALMAGIVGVLVYLLYPRISELLERTVN
ncbi:MAG: hypothetical protein ACE5FJ_11695 [Gemmatimonadales bacterium]